MYCSVMQLSLTFNCRFIYSCLNLHQCDLCFSSLTAVLFRQAVSICEVWRWTWHTARLFLVYLRQTINCCRRMWNSFLWYFCVIHFLLTYIDSIDSWRQINLPTQNTLTVHSTFTLFTLMHVRIHTVYPLSPPVVIHSLPLPPVDSLTHCSFIQ